MLPYGEIAAAGGGFSLLPLARLWREGGALKRKHFEHFTLMSPPLVAPVISVGGITTGGQGKTPFTVYLVKSAGKSGSRSSNTDPWLPAPVSSRDPDLCRRRESSTRGYRRRSTDLPSVDKRAYWYRREAL